MITIENQNQANYAFRKLKELKAEAEKINKYAEEEKALIEAWRAKELNPIEDSIQHFETMLLAYYTHVKEINPKFKLSVPHGKISTRKTKKYNYEDETALTAWLFEHHPNMIKTTQSFNKNEFKKEFKEGIDQSTGEVVPYVSITEEESHSFKLNDLEGLNNE